jgi:hypothetical protein
MAKDKKKAKKAKDSTRKAGPKTIAGVKVPKAARGSLASLTTLFNSELGREILADALIAAAGAAAAALTRTRTAKAAGNAVADAGSDAASASSDALQIAAGAVASVVTEAARNFLPSSLVGEHGGDKRKKQSFPHLAAAPEAKKGPREKGDKPSKH